MDSLEKLYKDKIARAQAHQARLIKTQGFGASEEAKAITTEFLPQLSSYIKAALMRPREELTRGNQHKAADAIQGLAGIIRQLDPDVVSLCVLSNTLHSIAAADNYRDTCITVGHALHGEFWAAKLLQHDGVLAGKIERAVKYKHGDVKYRKQAARSAAARAGFRMRTWTTDQRLIAGDMLAGWLLAAVPEIFVYTPGGEGWSTGKIDITVDGEALAMLAVEEGVRRHPVFLPSLSPPKPWTGFYVGGYGDGDKRRRDPLLRSRHKETAAITNAAIKDGVMQPFLDALNAIQAVPWTINRPVLDVIKACIEQGITVKGLPLRNPLPKPERDKEWEDMNDQERYLWKVKAGKIGTINRGLVSERVQVHEDVRTAELLAEAEAFWTPHNCDWRGRVYPMSHVNFQRDDRVRALFLYRDGAAIGEEGLWWLKVHVANCGEFDGVHKRSLEERVAWVDSNLNSIAQLVEDVFSNVWWTKANKPFLFLAACLELVAAIEAGPTYVTYLPVSFDGSCSGLQHLSAMTRAPEGYLVNLTPSALPQDVYQTVANVAKLRIERDLETEDANYARMCLAFGVDRKLVKRNVMTFSYSSKKFGMSEQHMEDTMRPLRFKVLTGALDAHPFDDNEQVQTGAARYLAGHVYDAITTVVDLPARAMGMLQQLAKALAHESKPLSWTTPTGLPWVNRYYEANYKSVQLFLHDTRVRVKLAVGDTKTIDKSKVTNGVAPNFVHALDASHLMLTASASKREGIDVATVHDSFGCLAPYAKRFNKIIREEFVRMYETHDVLAEILAAARRDITVHNSHRLPEGLQYGSLDIRQVLAADFAFA